MKHLYDWWFTYNHYTKTWAAMPNEHIPTYKNDHFTDKAIRSSSIDTLIWMIEQGEGDINKIPNPKIYNDAKS